MQLENTKSRLRTFVEPLPLASIVRLVSILFLLWFWKTNSDPQVRQLIYGWLLIIIPTLWLVPFLTGDDITGKRFGVGFFFIAFGIAWIALVGLASGMFAMQLAQQVEPEQVIPLMERTGQWLVFWAISLGIGYVLIEDTVQIARSGLYPRRPQSWHLEINLEPGGYSNEQIVAALQELQGVEYRSAADLVDKLKNYFNQRPSH